MDPPSQNQAGPAQDPHPPPWFPPKPEPSRPGPGPGCWRRNKSHFGFRSHFGSSLLDQA